MPLLRSIASMEVIMPVEKIGNVMDIASTNTRIKASPTKPSNPRPENLHGDVVSVGNLQKASDVGKITWPPLLPIGDTQSMFKIKK
jgi:hypothetical protein